MDYCQKCGNKNDEDAKYCNKCGNYLNKPSSFEKNIEEAAEELGRKAEEFGKRIEKRAKELTQTDEEKAQSTPKHCSDCDVDLDYDAKFCLKCGKEIE
jgi:uncharacterized membrane protein YvbJ